MPEIKVIMKRLSVTSNNKARRQGMRVLKRLPRQLLLAWSVKTVNIMTVDNTRNPPIWQEVYYHTLGNLGTVLSWWSEKSFYCRAALRCFLSKISFFFFKNLKRLINNWAVYSFQAVNYQETQSEELVLDNQLLLA